MQEVPQSEQSALEIVGPFEEYRVVWGGYEVPHIEARPMKDGTYYVTVDNRFGIHQSVTREELENWMPILANAMAVAAGWSCHGDNSRRPNPYMIRVSRLHREPSLTVIDGAKPREEVVQPDDQKP
jgi:hypothetical protein